jgi:multidrug efflux pump subunit AcrA (membrane-fusion protein)
MTAIIEIVAGTLEQAFRLPGSAVLGSETSRYVYVVTSGDGSDVVRRRLVRVARTLGATALIGPDSGLRAGERVVLRGQRSLRDGTPVEVSTPVDPELAPTPAAP